LWALPATHHPHFAALIPENELFRAREKVRTDLEVSEGLVRVRDFLAHGLEHNESDFDWSELIHTRQLAGPLYISASQSFAHLIKLFCIR
jgi:hypothetical protein